MTETVYSSVICLDGIAAKVDHPWQPWEYETTMVTLEIAVGCRDELDKQLMDAMLYGAGWSRVSATGIRHIPHAEFYS